MVCLRVGAGCLLGKFSGHGLSTAGVDGIRCSYLVMLACMPLSTVMVSLSLLGCLQAFGAVEAFSDRFCVKYNETVHISAEDLNSCCSECGGGCDGGFPEEAW